MKSGSLRNTGHWIQFALNTKNISFLDPKKHQLGGGATMLARRLKKHETS